ncbi:AraC family transcriptional regulator [Paenibacillus sp. WQ 127069]|uniref:AraC family transcriptional regulator n=1 Tax=Paenibacillus baimaensis TaxID=2982185 RepID=A0ABT2ULT2_9BACL|nr:AraC family transcriptional regulator [Paenibacillus sp. WQ 127069]MCU6795615.1 AraC family transcriptional regulator [Paenibacillus sp. WQ 127069]
MSMGLHNTETDIETLFQQTLLEVSAIEYLDYGSYRSEESSELDHHVLLFIVGGSGEMLLHGQMLQLSRKHVLLLLPGMKAVINSMHQANLKLYRVSFELYRQSESTDSYRGYEKERSFPVQGQIAIHQYGLFSRLIKLLYDNRHSLDVAMKLQQSIYMYAILRMLLKEAQSVITIDTWNAFDQSVRYMQDAYHTDITLDKLADLAGLNPSYYSTLFKQKMDKSPIEYLTGLRMNRAKELLLLSQDKIRNVAREVGYKDEFYFSRRFKAQYGVAPSVYLKHHHSNVASLSYACTDHLYTLGIVPYAARIDKGPTSITDRVSEPLESSQSWDIWRQKLIRAKPDMIMCKENISLQARNNIGDIAPIIVIPWMQKDIFYHIQEIAQLVDKEQAAKEWRERHEQRVELARKKVGSATGSKSVVICTFTTNGLRIYGARNMGHVFYRSLQMRPPEKLQRQIDKYDIGTGLVWVAASAEEIGDYEADYLLLIANSEQEARAGMKQLQATEAWLRHPAVKSGRVFFMSFNQWLIYAPDSIDRQLEEAVALLAGSGGRQLI